MKTLFWVYDFFIFVQMFEISSEFLFDFRFSGIKSQRKRKLAEKITHFTIQFRIKSLTHFMNLNLLDIENNMLPQCSQKPF